MEFVVLEGTVSIQQAFAASASLRGNSSECCDYQKYAVYLASENGTREHFDGLGIDTYANQASTIGRKK